MSGKGKPAHGGSRERAKMETAAIGKAAISCEYLTTPTAGRQPKIAALLSHGAENATPLRQLVAITGLPERVVRRQIQAERKAGALIMADNRCGYFLPEGPDDLKRFYRSMAHRADEIMSAARMAEAAYLDALGQTVLEGWRDG